MKNFFLLILSLIFISPSFGQEKNIYKQALANLYNYSTIGYRDFSDVFTQGDLVYTNSENDFAISGEGFFKLTDLKTGNILFTRNGQFIKQKNELYSVNGLKVITDNGIPVIFSAKEFDYTTDDNIYFLIKSDSFRIESKAIKGCLELSNVYPLDSLNLLIRYISEVEMSLPAFDRILSELNGLRDSYKEFVQTRKIETLTDYIMRLEMDKIIFYSILDKI
jgi:flagellar basal body rod protein FlgG